MYRQLMMHAGIFRIPPCVQVIIQKSVMLHFSADVLTDFHNVVARGTPIRSPGKQDD